MSADLIPPTPQQRGPAGQAGPQKYPEVLAPGTIIAQNTHVGKRRINSGEPPPQHGRVAACTACLVQAQESPSHTRDPSISRFLPPFACRQTVLSTLCVVKRQLDGRRLISARNCN